MGAARSSQKVRNVRTGRPQPRCIMPDRSMCSRSWHPAQKAHSESAEEHQKQAHIIGVILYITGYTRDIDIRIRSRKSQITTQTPVICFAHKKYKSGALGAARSPQKVRNVRTARPQPRCIVPDRSMCSRSWHPAQKAHSEPLLYFLCAKQMTPIIYGSLLLVLLC